MRRSERRRVDWEEEERRSEQSRAQGLKWTLLSLLAVILYLVFLRARHPEWNITGVLQVVAALALGVAIMIRMARRNKK